MAKLNVLQNEISIISVDGQDYISLTDMANARTDNARAADVIKNWIPNRYTIELLGTWRLSITRILKWSNLTTLNHKPVYPASCFSVPYILM